MFVVACVCTPASRRPMASTTRARTVALPTTLVYFYRYCFNPPPPLPPNPLTVYPPTPPITPPFALFILFFCIVYKHPSPPATKDQTKLPAKTNEKKDRTSSSQNEHIRVKRLIHLYLPLSLPPPLPVGVRRPCCMLLSIGSMLCSSAQRIIRRRIVQARNACILYEVYACTWRAHSRFDVSVVLPRTDLRTRDCAGTGFFWGGLADGMAYWIDALQQHERHRPASETTSPRLTTWVEHRDHQTI